MNPMMERAHQLIFGSYVRDESGGRTRRMGVDLIVMSHETFRELLREDFSGSFVQHDIVKGITDRCGPARVAYDDSMSLGQMIVAEAQGDTGEVRAAEPHAGRERWLK